MGDQIGMSQQELADMLRTKTRAFTEEEIQVKFKGAKPKRKSAAVGASSWGRILWRTAASWGLAGAVGTEKGHLKST